MKIKKLEILGFKSFVDRTVVNFDHDITAIVGPNGCGKSNIVDAIKWVMGEQAPSRLRGKSMSDVIFNGSEARGPHGFAEVTLTFDNGDGLASPEYNAYAEIEVSRRLDREGRSDYAINRTPVRLADITNLFLGTGVGKRAYSIIEQGRIGYIVTSKAEDRRAIIEDAAGVSRFRERKKAAERKMDHTRQNLLRVTDIVGELEKSINSLRRQAQTAERYKRYRSELRELDLYASAHKYLEQHLAHQVTSRAWHAAQQGAADKRVHLLSEEAQTEALRVQLQTDASLVEQAQAVAYHLDTQVKQLEGWIEQQELRVGTLGEQEKIADRELGEVKARVEALKRERESIAVGLLDNEERERASAQLLQEALEELNRRKTAVGQAQQEFQAAQNELGQTRSAIARANAVVEGIGVRREQAEQTIARKQQEQEQIQSTVHSLRQREHELTARVEGLRDGKSHTAERRAEIESGLEDKKRALQAHEIAVETTREQLSAKRSRLDSLRQVLQRFEGVGAGARALMTRYAGDEATRARTGVVGLVADRVDCKANKQEYQLVLSATLGDRVQHVVVRNNEAASAALGFLRDSKSGRATVMSQEPVADETLVSRAREICERGASQVAGVRGALIDAIEFEASDRAWVHAILGGVIVVEHHAAALQVREQFEGAHALMFVTTDGDVLRPDGSWTGGTTDRAAEHLLEMKHETRTLHDDVTRLSAELTVAQQAQTAARVLLAEHQAAIDAARAEAHGAELNALGAERDLSASQKELAQAELRTAQVEAEQREARTRLEALADELALQERALTELGSTLHTAEQGAATIEGRLTERRAHMDEQNERVTQVRVTATQTTERATHDRSALKRIDGEATALVDRDQRLNADRTSATRDQGQARGRALLHAGRLAEVVRESITAKDDVGVAREKFDATQQSVERSETILRASRSELESFTAEGSSLAVHERELTIAIAHLTEQVAERYDIDVRHVLHEYHDRPIPSAEVYDRIDELHRLIERMGSINLTAIEEFEEQNERFEYLSAQRADLQNALDQLDRAIRQMNKESRVLFRDAFNEINERFKRVFPILFSGGKAELKLSDPQDLLETGVEIIAQPPGKKLGSLELMSGGEKALTAVALIFAIFQYKPSPFCLLDEVDAPLDEANISRFAHAVQQMTDRSQFIVITHSKRTMEYADVLYGVTMEQPGVSKLVSVELDGERAAERKSRRAQAKLDKQSKGAPNDARADKSHTGSPASGSTAATAAE